MTLTLLASCLNCHLNFYQSPVDQLELISLSLTPSAVARQICSNPGGIHTTAHIKNCTAGLLLLPLLLPCLGNHG